jgi:ribonuclease T2
MKKRSDKIECHDPAFLTEDQYQASNFTFHGLWPNKKDCGTSYGECKDETPQVVEARHTNATSDPKNPLGLCPETLPILGQVMPSVRAGSGLATHEWKKHGTCQSRGRDEYFLYAAYLVVQFNASAVADLIRKNIGKMVTSEELHKAVDQSFGPDAWRNFIFVCKSDMLTEVQIPLTRELLAGAELKTLIDRQAKGYSRCKKGRLIKIDEIGVLRSLRTWP